MKAMCLQAANLICMMAEVVRKLSRGSFAFIMAATIITSITAFAGSLHGNIAMYTSLFSSSNPTIVAKLTSCAGVEVPLAAYVDSDGYVYLDGDAPASFTYCTFTITATAHFAPKTAEELGL